MSLCNEALLELSNPGASGSLFYVTGDNQFIIKTVDHKEADFLQKLLPGYYLVRHSCFLPSCLSVCHFCMPAFLSVCLSLCLPHLSVLSVCQSVPLTSKLTESPVSVCLSVLQSQHVCPFVCLSSCLIKKKTVMFIQYQTVKNVCTLQLVFLCFVSES